MADAATPAAPSAQAGARPAAGGTSAPEIKIKTRKPRQRACDEKDAKGKVCAGHLKRYYDYPKKVERLVGPKAEVYRCENCRTLYRPDTDELPRSYVLRY